MSRQALRSAWARTKPELEGNCLPHRTYFRQFSATPCHWDNAGNNSSSSSGTTSSSSSKPAFRQRAQQVSNEVSSLARGGRGGARGSPARGSRFQAQPRGDATSPAATEGGPRVLDVRSLPAGFRGRGGGAGAPGGLRGRGGFRGAGRRPAPTRGRGGSSAAGGRGGAPFRGRRRPAGAATTGQQRSSDSREDSGKDEGAEMEELAEQAFQRSIKQGERTVFNPSVSREDLQTYMPHFATGDAGRRATVMENLAQLGTSEPVTAPQELQPLDYARGLKRNGLQFFADLREREYTEAYLQAEKQRKSELAEAKAWFADDSADRQGPKEVALPEGAQAEGAEAQQQSRTEQLIGDVEESVKQVILDRAVSGKYEKPKVGTGPAQLARAQHLLSGTYTSANVNAFEQKINSLLAGRMGGQKGGKGKAKAAKAG